MTTFTVTATQGGASENGMAMTLVVLTGNSGTQPGAIADALSATPSLSITPLATGSWVYGALLTSSTVLSALSGTTNKQYATGAGLGFLQIRSTSTTTASIPVTLGEGGTTHGIGIALCEIEASGTLAEDASAPAPVGYAAVKTLTTASFTPVTGGLMVLMIATNGNTGTTTMSVSDTSGLSLTWNEQVKANGSSSGYAGVWTAQLPSAGTVNSAFSASLAMSGDVRGLFIPPATGTWEWPP